MLWSPSHRGPRERTCSSVRLTTARGLRVVCTWPMGTAASRRDAYHAVWVWGYRLSAFSILILKAR